MTTSRNPKVLNNALKYELNPVIEKIDALELNIAEVETYIKEVEAEEARLINLAEERHNEYKAARTELSNLITKLKEQLSNLIKRNLYDPNTATASDDDDTVTTEETKFINDKIVKAAGYGFVITGKDYNMYGVTGKGLAFGEDPGADLEYDWRNPDNDIYPFPSYYINDILMVDSETALLSTNKGVIKYYVDKGMYNVFDTTYGLPSKEVMSILRIKTKDGSIKGYLAVTSIGLAYSPTGEIWTKWGENFVDPIVCVSNTNYFIDEQTIVFIGTTNGIKYIDCDKALNGNIEIGALEGSARLLLNSYVNGLAYDIENDRLCAATNGGATIIREVSSIIEEERELSSSDITNFTNRSGLVGTSCYDAVFTKDHALILATSNGLSLSKNMATFSSITRTKNDWKPETNETLNNHVCNKIVKKTVDTYTVLHGVGLTEGIHL